MTVAKPKNPAQWVPINTLKPFPGNPKQGDVREIQVSMRRNGVYRPVIVQKSTRYIMAGNHTWLAAKAEGHDGIWAWIIDCDDTTAKRINLGDNRLPELGSYDEAALLAMLTSLPDLEGTGYSDADLAKMLPAPPEELDGGEVPDDGYTAQLGVVVICESTEQQEAIYEQLKKTAMDDPTWEAVELKVVAV